MFRTLHEPPPGQPPSLRLLPILGPSGCGKSSLARAGLLPALARQPLPGLQQPRVAILTPGTHPVEALAGVLARIATDDPVPVPKTREFVEELYKPGMSGAYDGLRRIAAALPGIDTSPLIVLIDQCEELYALCEDTEAQNVFVANLLHAVADRAARISVILTLRSDFLGQTQRHPTLNQAIAARGVIVPAMDAAELRLAIAEPAARAGHAFDAATVDLLLAETEGHEGALPLLQFALTRIWEGLADGVAPVDTLRQIGGVGGALAREAQRLYDSLSETDQAIARRAFLGLVRLGEGTRDTRRRIAVADLVAHGEVPDHVREVLRLFSRPSARLITFAADADGTDTAEITHEALFEHWEVLQTWLARSRADLRFHRRVDEAAKHWEEQGRPAGSLWSSPDLDLLRVFHQRAGSDMTEVQTAFFQASVRKERRAMRLRRAFIAALIALALAAGGIVYVARQAQTAAQERDRAQHAKQEAEAERNHAASLQRDLGVSYSKIGDTLRATGDTAGALEQYRNQWC